jgi:cytochrome c-type biogenesis protein CcmH/NrfF
VIGLVLVLGVLASGGGPASLPDVEDEVMCVQCKTALNVSQSAVADQERAFIRRQIAEGKNKQQVKAALVREFGPGVLATPQEKGFSLTVYLVPIALGLLALVGLGVAARRWRRRPTPVTDAPEPLDGDDERRLDAELAAYDRR